MRRSTMGLMPTLAFAILAAPLLPLAQPPAKVPRIGFLLLGASSDNPDLLDEFRQGLRELGWVEGQNIAIASRYAEGDPDRFAALAAECVRLRSMSFWWAIRWQPRLPSTRPRAKPPLKSSCPRHGPCPCTG